MAKPFLKWPGGKTQLLNELTARMPAVYKTLHEPFVGGGALTLHLEPQNAAIYDLNSDLIHTYTIVRDHTDDVIEMLRDLKREAAFHGLARTFQGIRARFNNTRLTGTDYVYQDDALEVARAAWMIFLNKTCFNGLWRENKKGEFNVPVGRYAKPAILQEDLLRDAARVLAPIAILYGSFEQIEAQTEPGDFVYFDPPYQPVSPTSSFTTFTKNGFGETEQVALVQLAKRLIANGVQVMLSNADHAFVRGLYNDPCFTIDQVMAKRSINAKGSKRGPVPEVVITGGYRRQVA